MTRYIRLLLAGALLLGAISTARAAITVARMEGFKKTWIFRNTDTKYTEIDSSGCSATPPSGVGIGYFKDYNGDGLLDYLICLQDKQDNSMRLFTISTAPSSTDKTYADKTAGRDFVTAWGSFVPISVHAPRSPRMAEPDLIVSGSNRANASDMYLDKLIFKRLNKNNPAWPDEVSWTLTLPYKAQWNVVWALDSYDNDDYPDFFVYSPTPTAGNTFALELHSGKDGALIWKKTLPLAADDLGMGSAFMIYPFDLSNSANAGNGDFDNDGKPEILLYYNYMNFDTATLKMVSHTCLNLLSSSGALSSASWIPVSASGAKILPVYDLDHDGYRDVLLMNMSKSAFPDGPVFMGYSMKKNASLFSSKDSDFGAASTDADHYLFLGIPSTSSAPPVDVTGDGKMDLAAYRIMNDATNPLRVGLFNAFGGGGSKVWLTTFSNFDYANLSNDFNYDGSYDFSLIKNLSSPNNLSWTFTNTALTKTGPTLGKQLSYTATPVNWDPATQSFNINIAAVYNCYDRNGNGWRDSGAYVNWEIQNTSDDSVVKAGGSQIVYDTPPPANGAAASRFAALDVVADGTDASDFNVLTPLRSAMAMNDFSFVDNDKNGYTDDIVVYNNKIIMALSFGNVGKYLAPGQAKSPVPADGSSLTANAPLRWSPSDGFDGGYWLSFDIYIGTSSAAVAAATRGSAEYRGNQMAPIYLPRPALSPNTRYWWRIDTVNDWGKVTKGAVWGVNTTAGASRTGVAPAAWQKFN